MTNTTDTHRASLGAILSVITGKLVAPLDELYGLQDFLADRPLMTHERTLAFERQGQAMVCQFPRLAEVEAPEFTRDASGSAEASVRAWVADVAAHVGWTEADVQFVPGCEVDPSEAWDKILAGRA